MPSPPVQREPMSGLRYFLSQFHYAFFDRILHGVRLSGHCRLYGLSPSGVTTCTIAGNQNASSRTRLGRMGMPGSACDPTHRVRVSALLTALPELARSGPYRR